MLPNHAMTSKGHMLVKNKLLYIMAAVSAAAVLGWVGLYDYIPDNHHGLWRINRLTHQAYYAENNGDWQTVKEPVSNPFDQLDTKVAPNPAEFDLSTARPITRGSP